ncbi:hypothetical protein BJ165DRAFT_1408352 [Panaeolus papilionaceus]|nr:hypothetical protein BJ165DRAFT_1408352 [Panaeolus papilionaceus]
MLIKRCYRLEELVIAYTCGVFLQTSSPDEQTDPIWRTLMPVQKNLQNLEFILGRWPPTPYTNCSSNLASFLQLPPDAYFASLATLHLKLLIRSPLNTTVNVDDDSSLKDIRDSLRNHKAFPNLHSVQISAIDDDFLHTRAASAWVLD